MDFVGGTQNPTVLSSTRFLLLLSCLCLRNTAVYLERSRIPSDRCFRWAFTYFDGTKHHGSFLLLIRTYETDIAQHGV